MWADAEEARSDFILAAAALVFGGFVVALLAAIPFYPRTGLAGALLALLWLFVLTALVPLLLARYRDDHGAFGLDSDRRAALSGLLLAAPVVVAAVLRGLGGDPLRALLGRFGRGAPLNAAVADPAAAATSVFDVVVAALHVAVLAAGAVLLFGFLTTRARDGFRRNELSATQAIRTFGLAAVGVAALLGLLRAIAGAGLLSQLATVAALAVVVLLADRLVPPNVTVSRATVIAPAIVAVVASLVGTGGLFGDLLLGLYRGALAAGVVIVIACLVESRRAWAVVPLAVAVALYPASCLSPLGLDVPLGC